MQPDTQTQDLAHRVRELEGQVRHSQDRYDALRGRLHFERMICDLSATFVNLPPDLVDQTIEHGLKLLVESLGADRSTFAEFSTAAPCHF